MSYFLTTPTQASQPGNELARELSEVATHVRTFIAKSRLTKLELQAMKLVEASLRHGAAVAKTIQP